jgi:hypothetical protein
MVQGAPAQGLTEVEQIVNPYAANDSSYRLVFWGAGSDATLGPLTLGFIFVPSSYGPNRYVVIDTTDDSGIKRPIGFNGNVVAMTSDFIVSTAGKGIILTNAAGTVTKRVRLNDAGNGLLFETP